MNTMDTLTKNAKVERTPAPGKPAPKAKEDRHFVTALARGLEVLSCFRSGDKALGNQEIAQRCRLPKSTVSRLTSTLTKLGYLIQVEESGKYRLGTATLSLGSAMLARLDVRQIARPMMQELADTTRSGEPRKLSSALRRAGPIPSIWSSSDSCIPARRRTR